MQILLTTLLSIAVAVATMFGVYNFVPLSTIGFEHEGVQKFGATITTIAASDTLKNSRTTINDNFTALNDGKIENSTTSVAAITTLSNLTTAGSLATVGTITSGTWTGSVIDVARQGTGTTSPSLYRVVLGNGLQGFTIASGTGSSGQFLTSNGATAYPSWQTSSVNQGDNYSWTGTHNFTGTTYIKNLNASSTSANPLTLNGLTYNLKSTRSASSTVLQEDGSGNLLFDKVDFQQLCEQILTSNNATSTCSWTGSATDLLIVFDVVGASGGDYPQLTFNTDYTGNGMNYGYQVFLNYVSNDSSGATKAVIFAAGATTTAQSFQIAVTNTATRSKLVNWDGGSKSTKNTGIGAWNNTTDQITQVNLRTNTVSQTWTSGTRLSVYGKRN